MALAANPTDHSGALSAYEAQHRPLVEAKQRRMGLAAGLLIPKTRLGIGVRNAVARLWLAG
jgi:hypothetical protein